MGSEYICIGGRAHGQKITISGDRLSLPFETEEMAATAYPSALSYSTENYSVQTIIIGRGHQRRLFDVLLREGMDRNDPEVVAIATSEVNHHEMLSKSVVIDKQTIRDYPGSFGVVADEMEGLSVADEIHAVLNTKTKGIIDDPDFMEFIHHPSTIVVPPSPGQERLVAENLDRLRKCSGRKTTYRWIASDQTYDHVIKSIPGWATVWDVGQHFLMFGIPILRCRQSPPMGQLGDLCLVDMEQRQRMASGLSVAENSFIVLGEK